MRRGEYSSPEIMGHFTVEKSVLLMGDVKELVIKCITIYAQCLPA
jgi:hypothetical protein